MSHLLFLPEKFHFKAFKKIFKRAGGEKNDPNTQLLEQCQEEGHQRGHAVPMV